jgi:hypothetical protein
MADVLTFFLFKDKQIPSVRALPGAIHSFPKHGIQGKEHRKKSPRCGRNLGWMPSSARS